MRASAQVTVYETKPATEWVLGAPVQKMSPKYAHSVLQGSLCALLRPWAAGRGRVGPEWRFWLTPPGEEARYLVPDVAYLSYARLPRANRAEAEEPNVAPDAAFEVLSPSERAAHVAHKARVYLGSGSALVAIVDPEARTVLALDTAGERLFRGADVFEHPALPGFALNLAAFFAELDV